jgi:hypothetical protein
MKSEWVAHLFQLGGKTARANCGSGDFERWMCIFRDGGYTLICFVLLCFGVFQFERRCPFLKVKQSVGGK